MTTTFHIHIFTPPTLRPVHFLWCLCSWWSTFLTLWDSPKTICDNQEFQRGFSLVYLHYIYLPRSPSDHIPQTSKFFCMLLIPICIWNPRQFAIGGYFILRTEAGEYVFISLIANEVLEDKQRICTWNQHTAPDLAFWLVMKNVSSTLIGQSWSWVQQTEWFLPERQNNKGWEGLI